MPRNHYLTEAVTDAIWEVRRSGRLQRPRRTLEVANFASVVVGVDLA